MKACSCGAWAEQKRFRMGWLTPTEVRAIKRDGTAAVTCAHCAWSAPAKSHASRLCNHTLGDFATASGATCSNAKGDIP